jgi:hypothetical protein
METINKTTKRLLSASYLNITFDYASGHRWVTFHEDGGDIESMYEKLEKHKLHPNTKVYGNIIDALNFVDYLLVKMSEKTLEQRFDDFNNWGFDDEFVGEHTCWEDSGTENETYFQSRV